MKDTSKINSKNTRNKSFSENKSSSSKDVCVFSDFYSQAKDFETSLRNYKNPSSIRVFKNYSKSKGNYFDSKYQYGGESVVPSKRNFTDHTRSKTVSNKNESKDSIYKLTHQSNKNKI